MFWKKADYIRDAISVRNIITKDDPTMAQSGIPFAETIRYWLKLGFINFGGPTGQIAMMHKDLVEKKKWIAEDHFLQALNFCMLLPGPEAQQLATYIGWHLNGKWGGIVAGGLFVLPSIFILWALAWLYASLGTVPMVSAVFYGLKPAVVAIVLEAVLRIGKKTLKTSIPVYPCRRGIHRDILFQRAVPGHRIIRWPDRLFFRYRPRSQ